MRLLFYTITKKKKKKKIPSVTLSYVDVEGCGCCPVGWLLVLLMPCFSGKKYVLGRKQKVYNIKVSLILQWIQLSVTVLKFSLFLLVLRPSENISWSNWYMKRNSRLKETGLYYVDITQ